MEDSEETNSNELSEIRIQANPFTIVDDFLAHIISKINRKLKENRANYLLSNNRDLFSLMIAKKNGEPKTDYPGTKFRGKLKFKSKL